MVKNDNFVLFVLVVVELGDVLISFDVGAWEIQSLSYMVFLVFIGLAEVNQQEIGLETDGQLFGFDGDGGEVGDLTAGIIFGLIPSIDGLAFFFLVDKFPKCGRFNSSEELIFLFSSLFGT